MDRFWQQAVQGRFHAPRIQVVLVTRDSHRRHAFLRSVFSALSSLLCLAYRDAMHTVAAHLGALGALPDAFTVDTTADLLWLWFGPAGWHALVTESGWT
jgi:hypothetical protein